MKKNIYFIVKHLYPKAGGLTKSIYDKANLLAEYHNVTILLTEFQLHLSGIYDDLVKQNKLSNKVRIKNVFLDLRDTNSNIGQKKVFDYENLLHDLHNPQTNKKTNRV